MKVKVVGSYNWRDSRFKLVTMLENAKTEEQFSKAVAIILCSCGTLPEMKKRRKQLGIEQFTKEEIRSMK